MKREKIGNNEPLDSRLRENDKSRGNGRKAFTLVEILVTITVIAILLGLLIPSLSSIERTALKVKQRTQFHGIETALEAFSTDMGDYPPSTWDNIDDGVGIYYGPYSASQRLAEALVGRDGFGFHPDSPFRYDGKGDIDGDGFLDPVAAADTLYDVVNGVVASDSIQTAADNLAVRKGPYLELENANAVKLSNLYGAGNYGSLVDTFVFSDMYKVTKNTATGKMTGSPILYYKADRTKYLHSSGVFSSRTYNVYDSLGDDSSSKIGIASLDPLDKVKSGQEHPISDDEAVFYQQTQNPNFTSPPRPYRAESFILHSAGADSLYGTADDVFNFDREY